MEPGRGWEGQQGGAGRELEATTQKPAVEKGGRGDALWTCLRQPVSCPESLDNSDLCRVCPTAWHLQAA